MDKAQQVEAALYPVQHFRVVGNKEGWLTGCGLPGWVKHPSLPYWGEAYDNVCQVCLNFSLSDDQG